MLDDNSIQEAIEGNTRRNAELLTILRGKGVVLDASHTIEFHYWAWNQANAIRLKNTLIQNGASVKEVLSVKEGDEHLWSITTEVNTTPSLAASLKQTRTNVILAAEFDCVYDGWGMRL
jgi:regulator of RNase E activity RraB